MKVFCDIDGVLTDFATAYCQRTGIYIPINKFNEIDFPKFVGKDIKLIDAELDYEFWSTLPWMKYGKIFLSNIEGIFGIENICLLSFPSYSKEGPAGKIAWVKRELPEYEMRLILAFDKRFCAASGSRSQFR